MNKKLQLFFGMLILCCTCVFAQTPQYYNTNATGGANSFPFSTSDRKIQWLHNPGEWKTAGTAGGTVAPSGMITTVYFYPASSGTAVMSTFSISLKSVSYTTFGSATYESGLTTGFSASSYTVTGTANTWLAIPLTTPFYYDNTMSVVIDVSQLSQTGGGFTLNQPGGFAGSRRIYGAASTGVGGGPDAALCAFGVDISPGGLNGPPLPPIAGFFPSSPNTTSTPPDTVWMNAPYKLVSTSTNTGRAYWDLPGESPLNAGYGRQNVAYTTQTYIDTAKYDGSFTYNFTRRGFWPVRVLAINTSRRDSLRDSTVRYIWVDTPSTKPKPNFFTSRRKIGFGEYGTFVDISSNGPNNWFWWYYRSSDSSTCNKCNNPPFFPNFFAGPTDQNPTFFGGDPGLWSICMQAWNARGWDTVCKKDYIEVLNSYYVCSGNVPVATDPQGFLFGPAGPTLSYTRSQIGSCTGILIAPCADSVIMWIDRLKLLPTDTLVFRNGNTASSPIIQKIGGSNVSQVPASVKSNGIRAGKFMYLSFQLGTGTVPNPYDTAGFSIRWEIKPPTYPKPVAAMQIPDTVYNLQPVTYTSKSTGTLVNYIWDTDGNGTYDSTGAVTTRTFVVTSSNYKRICHVAYNCVGSDTVCKNVIFLPVTQKPEARFIANKLQGFNTDSFYFTDKSLYGPNQWKWTFTPAAQFLVGTSSTSQNPVMRFTQRTKYTVKLVVTNSVGKDSVTKVDYINIGAYDQPQCLNDISLADGSIGISRVKLEGIDTTVNPTTPCYQFVTGNQSANLYRGKTSVLTITRPATTSPMDRKAWIDYNLDGTFDNSELVMNESNSYSLTGNANITLSPTQITGGTRMRVGVAYAGTTLNPSATFLGVFRDYVINMPQDTVKPTIALRGSSIAYTEIHKAYRDSGVTAFDNIEGIISSRYQIIGTVDTSKVGPNYLKYIVSDLYGNVSDTVRRTVFVTLNQSGPTLTLNPPAIQYVEVYNKYVEKGWTALDNQGNNISNQVVISGSVDTTKLGGNNLNYLITDGFGYTASGSRLVNVGDTTRPVIRLKKGNPYYHQVGSALDLYKDVVYVDDNFWKNLSVNAPQGVVDVNSVGTYYVIFNATDGSGNIANQVVVQIIVADKVAPNINLNGGNPLSTEVLQTFNDPGVNATDNYWPKNTLSITYKPNVIPTNTLSTGNGILRWYVVCDPSGNCDSISRFIKVIDSTKPTIQLLGGSQVNMLQWTKYAEPGVQLIDNYDSDAAMRPYLQITSNLSTDSQGNLFGDKIGLFSVTYKVHDLSNNFSTAVTRLVNVGASGVSEVMNVENIMSVYPNPSNGLINMRLVQQLDTDLHIAVLDIQGREVFERKLSGKNLAVESFDLSQLSKGIYVLRVQAGERTYMKKLQLN